MNQKPARARLLLVEDNALNRKITSNVLEDAGFNCALASNGIAALELLGRSSFDLVLMDVEMPVMDGLTATRQLRETFGQSLPVIALTAHEDAADHEACFAAGMNACVVKPFEKEALLAVIEEQLGLQAETPEEKNPSAPVSDETKKWVDLSYLESLSKGSEEFFQSMIDLYLVQNANDIARLREGIRAKNFETARLLAHKIKTSVVFMGLEKHLHARLAELEWLCVEHAPIESITALFSQVEKICAAADAELRSYQKKQTPL